MEQNLPIVAKKFWKMVRVFYFMLKKSISKAKLLEDLNMMRKRGKIAGKAAIHNLLFHHSAAARQHSNDEPQLSYPTPLNEFKFSCCNSRAYPTFHLPFHLNKRKRSHSRRQPSDGDLFFDALEMVSSSQAASPALPGFQLTPMVRQLRITDSPFPLTGVEEDAHVDEAAEKFIIKFYRNLGLQNSPLP